MVMVVVVIVAAVVEEETVTSVVMVLLLLLVVVVVFCTVNVRALFTDSSTGLAHRKHSQYNCQLIIYSKWILLFIIRLQHIRAKPLLLFLL
jgi:hypothetical protein